MGAELLAHEPVASTPLLELRGVGKSYGSLPVLRGIDLALETGELVAVLGYSGAGKTTLMSIVAGLMAPDAGQVLLSGQPVQAPGPDRAVVFQTYSLLPWLTARENVALAVDQVHADWTPERRAAWTDEHLALVKLADAGQKRPHELSGGMRQRVALTRALAMSPRMLLLDEPMGALDALTRASLQDEIERICRTKGTTALLVTNDVDEALLMADRIIPMSAGPAATLGPSVRVTAPRPRDRRSLRTDARLLEARAAVLDYLLGPGKPGGVVPEALVSAHRPRALGRAVST